MIVEPHVFYCGRIEYVTIHAILVKQIKNHGRFLSMMMALSIIINKPGNTMDNYVYCTSL